MHVHRYSERTPLHVLVDKSFRFVEDVWFMYIKRNMLQETTRVCICGQNTSANLAIFIRTTAAMNEEDDGEEDDGEEVEDGEDDNLENDGNDVSDGEEHGEV